MGKTRKDRRDRDYFGNTDDSLKDKKGQKRRQPREWKQYENSSTDDILNLYDPEVEDG